MQRQRDTMTWTYLEGRRIIKYTTLNENSSASLWLMSRTDTIQDLDMAAGRRADDRRDCQQWHALSAFVAGGGRPSARSGAHRLPRSLCPVHELVAYPIQVEAS